MIEYKPEYLKIWSEILKQGSGLISLHKNDIYVDMVKSFDCKCFIIESAKYLSRSSFDELNLCFPFLWKNLNTGDVVEILKKLDGEKAEASLSIISFIGIYIGINVIDEYLKQDLGNVDFYKFVEDNYELITSKMKIGDVQNAMINESELPINDFYKMKENWLMKGFVGWY